MPEAKFIVLKEDDNKFLCNICSEEIDKDEIIGLKCNPSKHIFCYDCILDWYKQVLKNTNYQNYSQKNMCPICRKNGGLLPSCDKYKFIKGIHYSKVNNIISLCNVQLKNGKGLCKYKSCNTDGNSFCKLHKNLLNTTPIIDNNIPLINNNIPLINNTLEVNNIPLIDNILNPSKLPNECGIKLKNGKGYCTASGKKMYNGLCGRHCIKKEQNIDKNLIDINIDNNVIVI